MPRLKGRRAWRGFLAALGVTVLAVVAVSGAGAARGGDQLSKINHIVVIYEENHSFDNLYGGWEGVNGLANADAAHTTQVDQNGTPYSCLRQLDVNLTVPPLSKACDGTTPRGIAFNSHFLNTWFTIDNFIPPDATTCPKPKDSFAFANGILNGSGVGIPGGCTRDLVHKFYQEQYQLNGGAQNRYATGSDSAATVMGVYDTRALPIYKYLHSKSHPHYAIADNFFQAAFGGSFLNHQWLIAARTPFDPKAPAAQHSLIDSAGFPRNNYPLYNPLAGVTYRDGDFTVPCPSPKTGLACGDWAVNTMQPTNEPFGTFGDKLVVQGSPTIGDRLSSANISWGWYAGGWDNAAGITDGPGWTNGPGPTCSDPNHDTNAAYHYPKCPDFAFQFHHQPFSYFANYAPGTPGRAHLRDEVAFEDAARSSTTDCNLDAVSFVKPIGEENEHPGYASESIGSTHLMELVKLIQGSACAKDTMVVVTYDEFGGQWDHVSPPGQGNNNGPHDQWGPGTRIPTLVISPFLRGNFAVDHTQYDTTSILAMIE
ncbi:MAG TPA: alkaline phosphatase family protein, partial [Gaiellaceae bacterium]